MLLTTTRITTGIATLLLLAGATHASAQSLNGRVLEDGTESPVAGAIVGLVDRSGDTRAQAITDGSGRFRLSPPEAGEYVIHVEGLGYQDVDSPLFALGLQGSAEVELLLRPAPLGLEGFEVSVEREAELLLSNFSLTPAELGNRWINRADIEAMEMPGLAKDAIRWQNIAGVYIDEYDATDYAPLCVRFLRHSRQCAITVLDGTVVPPERAYGLNSDDVEAIAILNPTDSATFYGTAGGGGAILFWTRMGR